MIILITLLIILLVFCILYIRILSKENALLQQESDAYFLLNDELEKELKLTENLAKTFEIGYTNLKSKTTKK